MIYANITMLAIAINLSLNGTDFVTDGLVSIQYLDKNPCNYLYEGLFIPTTRGKGKIIICAHDEYNIIRILEHELKHLACWRSQPKKLMDNFNHKGCFQNVTVRREKNGSIAKVNSN